MLTYALGLHVSDACVFSYFVAIGGLGIPAAVLVVYVVCVTTVVDFAVCCLRPLFRQILTLSPPPTLLGKSGSAACANALLEVSHDGTPCGVWLVAKPCGLATFDFAS